MKGVNTLCLIRLMDLIRVECVRRAKKNIGNSRWNSLV